MITLEKLEREFHHLTQIIRADAQALVSKFTPRADRARLQRQIDTRTVQRAGLLQQLRVPQVSEPSDREAGHTPAKGYPRSEACQAYTALAARIDKIKQADAKSKSKMPEHRP